RASPPHRGGEMAHVVLVPVRPAERENAVHQIRERAFNVDVDPRAAFREHPLGELVALAQQPRALALAPGRKFLGNADGAHGLPGISSLRGLKPLWYSRSREEAI